MLDYNLEFLLSSANERVQRSFQLFHLGRFQWCFDEIVRAREDIHLDPNDHHRIELLQGELSRRGVGRISNRVVNLVWRIDPNCWEREWLIRLIGKTVHLEIDARKDIELPAARYIIADNKLSAESEIFYKKLNLGGSDLFLLHLSDEHFRDNLSAYKWCSLVYRNCYSPILDTMPHVKTFPLGYKSGIQVGTMGQTASEREYCWGFAGDVGKSTRARMFENMSKIDGGHCHLTSGFASADSLGTSDYQLLLQKSAFSPCPAGWVNVETFRIFEALESGSIPIIEYREKHNYYEKLFGVHPIPYVFDWAEVGVVFEKYKNKKDLNTLQADCYDWWRRRCEVLSIEMCRSISSPENNLL